MPEHKHVFGFSDKGKWFKRCECERNLLDKISNGRRTFPSDRYNSMKHWYRLDLCAQDYFTRKYIPSWKLEQMRKDLEKFTEGERNAKI